MTWRVAQWSVGGVGRHALGALVRSPEFEVVGVFTHSPERVGHATGDAIPADVNGAPGIVGLLDLMLGRRRALLG